MLSQRQILGEMNYPLKDNELWMIGGWRWLEQRLIHREMMQRERQKREEEFAQLNFLSALGIAA